METLTLKGSLNGDKVIDKLFNGLNLQNLKWLELSDNQLDCEGCSAINYSLTRSKLDYLELINCSLTEKKCLLLFEGLDLCWFKTKDSIQLDKNTLISNDGLKIINKAVINSGFILKLNDLGFEI